MSHLQRMRRRPQAVTGSRRAEARSTPAPRAERLPRPSQLPLVDRALASHREPLDAETRTSFEKQLGYAFERIRIHAGPEAAAGAEELHAAAFTVGSHVVFGAGRYRPASSEGKALLAHELVHVVQQAGGGTRRFESRLQADSSNSRHRTRAAAPSGRRRRPPRRAGCSSATSSRCSASRPRPGSFSTGPSAR